MKRRTKAALCAVLILTCNLGVFAEPSKQVDTDVSTRLVQAESGILMEASSKEVLYEWNPEKPLKIASVTKTMTMLLIMEALDSGKIQLEDTVTTSENAASMGGSQVFLEAGEQMSVEDMLKAIVVSSGNDAAVAMAEHIAGTHEAFVEKMNARAVQLGCNNTHFINCNGLDETDDHYSTARDVALITCELLKHPKILDYTTIWMDTIRNGAFGLSNTNKLIRFYQGANGMKTGSTAAAKYCLSATAERNGMQLIAVVLAAPSTAERFDSAKALLDYGFANYEVADSHSMELMMQEIPVRGGVAEMVMPAAEDISFVVKKGNRDKVEYRTELPKSMAAPVAEGEMMGEIIFTIDGEEIGRKPILAKEGVERINPFQMYLRMMKKWIAM